MVKFLLVSISLFLLYLGFSILTDLDSAVSIDIYDYHLETTFFTLIVVFVLFLVITLLLLKLIFLLFALPSIIHKKYQLNKAQKTYDYLLKAFANLIQQKDHKALEIIEKLGPNLKQNQQELMHLIAANAENKFDEQISHLRILFFKPEYEYYAAKKMADLFAKNKLYDQAEEYALRCYSINEKDFTVLDILVSCYGHLKRWDRFDFIAHKISSVNKSDYGLLAQKISNFYLIAAKETLANGEEKKANEYLRKALQTDLYNIEALDLYVTLNIDKEQTENILAILKNSYKQKPSFEIAQLIIRMLANLPAEKIYMELTNIVDPKVLPVMYLAIAAYLGLDSKNLAATNKLLS